MRGDSSPVKARARLVHPAVARAWLVASVAAAAVSIPGAQEKPIPVQVSLGDVSLNKLMYVIAHEEGIYRKNGLDVTQFITPRAAEVVRRSGVNVPAQYIRQGDAADVAITIGGGTPTIVGMTTNATAVQRVILATTDPVVRWHIIARPEITRAEQLKGRRLGYSGFGAMTHFMCLAFVEQMGWDRDRDLSLMANGAALDVLKDGRVDAFVADELDHTIALAAGFKSILNLGQYRIPIAGSSVNAARTWLKANQEAARRFVKSTVEAIALMKQDKQVVFRAMTKWYNLTDPKHQEFFSAAAADLPRKPYPAVEGIKKTIELYGYHELRKHSPEDFYDDSFVKELDRSGYIDSLYKSRPSP